MSKHFSLGIGGPLFHFFYQRLFPKRSDFIKQRLLLAPLITWLPLFLLAFLGERAFQGVRIPFMHDIDAHVRFFLVVPLLLYAESIANERLPVVVNKFLESKLIKKEEGPRFEKMIRSSLRFKNSLVVEILLLLLVYTFGQWISRSYLPLGVSSWFAVSQGQTFYWTAAGYWYLLVSLPLFQFILLRWYFRIGLWYYFLWRVSGLSLQLNSLHPDRAGGLGFLTFSIYALAPFLLTHSLLLFGMILNRIWNTGALLYDFQTEALGIIAVVFIIPLLPLLFFSFKMAQEKRMGTLRYETVASFYVNDFRRKWLDSEANNKALLGSSDIQSLADLFNSYEVSNKMRITPFNRNNLLSLAILLALPLLPLILTLIPLEKICSQIFRLIF